MSSETAYLTLLLDAPLQSWGFASRFQRRTTGLHPTKSGVVGLICAAMGLAKASTAEGEMLPKLAALKMTSISIQRERTDPWTGQETVLRVGRIEDFHTVLGTRRASGSLNKNPVVTHRQYLVDSRFGVILEGDRAVLERVSKALQDPVWGIWFGRKSCLPAEPIFRGLHATRPESERALIGSARLDAFTVVTEVDNFDEGTDSTSDQPVSFGDGKSSGLDTRQFAVRRIALRPAREREDVLEEHDDAPI